MRGVVCLSDSSWGELIIAMRRGLCLRVVTPVWTARLGELGVRLGSRLPGRGFVGSGSRFGGGSEEARLRTVGVPGGALGGAGRGVGGGRGGGLGGAPRGGGGEGSEHR